MRQFAHVGSGGLYRAGKPGRFLAAGRRAVRLNWLLTILFSAGLALRVLTQLAYRPALPYIDSGRYLSGWYAQDPLGYRVVLWPLQRPGGLAAVAAFQHILGVAMAGVLYLVLRRRGIWRWAAAASRRGAPRR
jgi:hypothetical protein